MLSVLFLIGGIWMTGLILKYAFKLTGFILKMLVWIPIVVMFGLGLSFIGGVFALSFGLIGVIVKMVLRALPLLILLGIIYYVVKTVWGDEKKEDNNETEIHRINDTPVYREFRETESTYARNFNNL